MSRNIPGAISRTVYAAPSANVDAGFKNVLHLGQPGGKHSTRVKSASAYSYDLSAVALQTCLNVSLDPALVTSPGNRISSVDINYFSDVIYSVDKTVFAYRETCGYEAFTTSINTFNYIKVTGGLIKLPTITVPGSGYVAGDILSLTGAPSGTGATVRVLSIGAGGAVSTIGLVESGSGYVNGGTIPSTTNLTGSGSGCTLAIPATLAVTTTVGPTILIKTGGTPINPFQSAGVYLDFIIAWSSLTQYTLTYDDSVSAQTATTYDAIEIYLDSVSDSVTPLQEYGFSPLGIAGYIAAQEGNNSFRMRILKPNWENGSNTDTIDPRNKLTALRGTDIDIVACARTDNVKPFKTNDISTSTWVAVDNQLLAECNLASSEDNSAEREIFSGIWKTFELPELDLPTAWWTPLGICTKENTPTNQGAIGFEFMDTRCTYVFPHGGTMDITLPDGTSLINVELNGTFIGVAWANVCAKYNDPSEPLIGKALSSFKSLFKNPYKLSEGSTIINTTKDWTKEDYEKLMLATYGSLKTGYTVFNTVGFTCVDALTTDQRFQEDGYQEIRFIVDDTAQGVRDVATAVITSGVKTPAAVNAIKFQVITELNRRLDLNIIAEVKSISVIEDPSSADTILVVYEFKPSLTARFVLITQTVNLRL